MLSCWVRDAQSVSGRWVLGGLIRLIPSTDRLVDNLSIDENSALWAAGVPSALRFLSAYRDPEKVAPSSAFRITKNVGEKAFFGEKLKVEKVGRRPLKRKGKCANRE
jgi:hypothetical protein